VLCRKVAVREASRAMLGRSFTVLVAVMGVRAIRGVPMVRPVVSPVLMVMVLVGVLLTVMVILRMMFVLNTVMVVAESVMKREVHHRHRLEAADPKQARQHGTPLATALSTMLEVHNCRRLAASFCPINRNFDTNCRRYSAAPGSIAEPSAPSRRSSKNSLMCTATLRPSAPKAYPPSRLDTMRPSA